MWRERCPLLVPCFWKFHGKNLSPERARSLQYITRLQQLSLWDSILLYVLVLLPRSMAEKRCWRQWLLAERIAILAFWPFTNLEPRSLFLTIPYWREYIPIQVLVDRVYPYLRFTITTGEVMVLRFVNGGQMRKIHGMWLYSICSHFSD
jgi:hypothetical protein